MAGLWLLRWVSVVGWVLLWRVWAGWYTRPAGEVFLAAGAAAYH